MRRRIRLLATIGALALVAAACSPADSDAANTTVPPEADPANTEPAPTLPPTTQPAPTTTTTEPAGPSLAIEATGWPTLQGGFHYEGWAIVDGEALTTGKFNVEGDALVDLDGTPIDRFGVEAIEGSEAIVITIEPSGDTDDIPSDTHFVAGDVVGGVAELTISHPAALANDFSAVSGSFLLATPTDDPDGNELSGIWFLELPGPAESLDLPELPTGWKYEGWAVIDGVPVTSGTFLTASGADDSAPFSGDGRMPAFPGEDYIQNAPDGLTFPTDLSGGTVVVSVEPFPDDSPEPFVLKPLIGTADENATDHVSYPLNANTEVLPTGRATISS